MSEEDKKVYCCMSCHRLYLIEEDMNTICQDCFTINKVEVLSDIYEWIRKYGRYNKVYGIQSN